MTPCERLAVRCAARCLPDELMARAAASVGDDDHHHPYHQIGGAHARACPSRAYQRRTRRAAGCATFGAARWRHPARAAKQTRNGGFGALSAYGRTRGCESAILQRIESEIRVRAVRLAPTTRPALCPLAAPLTYSTVRAPPLAPPALRRPSVRDLDARAWRVRNTARSASCACFETRRAACALANREAVRPDQPAARRARGHVRFRQ
eukprot:IDg4395t1